MFPSYVGEAAEEFGITTVDMSFIFQALEIIGQLDQPWRPTQGMVHCEEPGICDMLKERYRLDHDTLGMVGQVPPCHLRGDADLRRRHDRQGDRALASTFRTLPRKKAFERSSICGIRGADVVGETCPHYLIPDFPWQLGGLGKVNPPVHDRANVEYMWHGIHTGLLEVLGSDNCRFSLAEKQAKGMWDVIPGFSEIAATLPLLLTHGIAAGRIDWQTLASLTARMPCAAICDVSRRRAPCWKGLMLMSSSSIRRNMGPARR